MLRNYESITSIVAFLLAFANTPESAIAEQPKTAIHHPPGHLVSVNGTSLWVETEGTGEPLILLAGGPANSHLTFHPIFSELSNQFQIIYYDYRGRGRSDQPQNWHQITFDGDVDDLEGLRQALGLSRISL